MTTYIPDYDDIKNAVIKLLPAASMWSDVQWCNEQFILTQIDNAFHTHYAQTPSAFDYLVELALAASLGDTDPQIPLATLTELPLALLKHLWPDNTDNIIINLYSTAYRHVKYNEQLAKKRKDGELYYYEAGLADLSRSGIQRLAEGLVATGTIHGKRLKKQIFNVQIQH